MPKSAAARGNTGDGTPQTGQPAVGAAEGAAGVSAPEGQSDKRILGRFDTNEQVVEAYQKLEQEFGKRSNELQVAQEVLQSMSGLAEHVERDPISGKVKLKDEVLSKLGKGGDTSVKDHASLRASLMEKFTSGLESKEPAGAFVDVVLEAADAMIADRIKGVQSQVQGDLQDVQGNTELERYIRKNPEMEPLVEHVGAWLQNVPRAARAGIKLEDAFGVVKEKLRKSGKLESTGYEEPSDDASSSRGRTRLTGGSSGGGIEVNQQEADAASKKIKEDILAIKDPLKDFIGAPFALRGKKAPLP